ncbi:MAG: NAD-dependent epimerase/dehydratase family protein [Planctomycetaceae bacterium]|nr:NAD-dependent epimerase/dehydratase family protein [Planctomycetaceae bacterium]
MSILVTGGGGFLGRYIVEKLLARGERVKVFARGEYPDLEALGAEVIRGDIQNPQQVDDALNGISSVFHTAAVPGIWGPWSMYHGINTLGTNHVLDACRKHQVGRLVYTSSPSVVYDGKPHLDANESLPYPTDWFCHYPHSKALAEQAVLAADGREGLRTVALRPHLIWGPRDNHLIPRLIQRAKAGRLRRVGDGSNFVSMSYVENAADAHLQAFDALSSEAQCAGKAYFINEPEPVKLWDWVDEILAMADLPPVRKTISSGAAYSVGRILESVWGTLKLGGEPPMTRFLASQLSQSHSYSIENARKDFGYSPSVSIEEGMRRLAEQIGGERSEER